MDRTKLYQSKAKQNVSLVFTRRVQIVIRRREWTRIIVVPESNLGFDLLYYTVQ